MGRNSFPEEVFELRFPEKQGSQNQIYFKIHLCLNKDYLVYQNNFNYLPPVKDGGSGISMQEIMLLPA